MIKFFRKIRQQLLTENKFSKYVFYAIGEIVLVVIGILIALQINNWNEFKKSQENEGLLVDQIISDAKADSLFYQSRISVLQKQDSILDYILYINEFPKADTSSSIKVEHRLLPYISFVLLSEVLDNYDYSKENIGSWKIKQRLQELKTSYHYLESNFTLYSTELEKEVIPLDNLYYRVFKEAGSSATLDDLREIFISEELESIFAGLQNRSYQTMLVLERIIPINNTLLQELREYKLTFPE